MVSSADDLRRLLAERGVTNVLIGAHAANRYRLDARLTIDVDLLVDTLDGVAQLLNDNGWVVRAVAEDGAAFLISARHAGEAVDLLLAETEYQRQAMRRAKGGVLAVEDVIVHKLIAGRPRDRDDIESILATEPTLDNDYILDHAQAWDVADLWAEIRGGA